MKIAILDDYQDCVRGLHAFDKLAGHDVLVLNEALPADVLVERLADREALVLTRERTRFPAALIERLPALKVLSQTGRPGNHIDMDACRARGIAVLGGTGSPHAPAELTWALVLAARRRIVEEAVALQAGRWQTVLGETVRGRTLGILGYGNIGRLVAGFGRAFGMRVVAFGRAGSLERARADGVETVDSQRALFAASDVLSVHLRMAPETRHGISREDLDAMPAGALFVNTSRAELVAPGALAGALDASGAHGGCAMAALDVFEREPIVDAPVADDAVARLVRHPRVLAVPHLGYVERDSYEQYYGGAFDNLVAFAAGDTRSVVNPEALGAR